MANTIVSSTLSISINENIIINGVTYGNSIIRNIGGNGKADQRMMCITSTAFTSIFNYNTSLPDIAGQGVNSAFSYFRITNTDSAIGVTIRMYAGSGVYIYQYLPAGTSAILMDNTVDIQSASLSVPTLRPITSISAKADTISGKGNEVYVEYLAVFQGGYTPVEGEGGEVYTP